MNSYGVRALRSKLASTAASDYISSRANLQPSAAFQKQPYQKRMIDRTNNMPANSTHLPRLALLSIVALILASTITTSSSQGSNSLQGPTEFYYQPLSSEQSEILTRNQTVISEIIDDRCALLWGAGFQEYFTIFTGAVQDNPENASGLYYSDSLIIRRQSCWRTSEFATDLDFIDLSIYSKDGAYSLREVYAINQFNHTWAVIDSSGYPLFERVLDISAETADSEIDLERFLMTLLSYAGYGSNAILHSLDTTYHQVRLADTLEEYFYPFTREVRGDTTDIIFTTYMLNSVEITRWNLFWLPDGIEINENKLLLDYTAMPIVVDTAALAKAESDSIALAARLSNIESDTFFDSIPRNLNRSGRGISARSAGGANVRDGELGAGAPPGVPVPPVPQSNAAPRLADLIGGALPAMQSGHVSYEILGATMLIKADSLKMETIPEFLNFAEPVYPPVALAGGLEAVIEIKARIDTSGKARQVILMKKSDTKIGFEASAKTAATQSQFRPGIADGQKADMWLNYRLSFRMASSASPDSSDSDSSAQETTLDTTLDTLTDTLLDTLLDTFPKLLSDSISDSTSDTTITDSLADSTLADTLTLDSLVTDSLLTDSLVTDTLLSDSLVTDTTVVKDSTVDSTADSTADSSADSTSDSTSADSTSEND